MADFVTSDWQIRTSKVKKPVRMILIGDLHNTEHGENNADLKKATAAAEPDLILCVGDLIIGKPGLSRENALDYMRFCARRAPVFMVYGNHETQLRLFPEEEKSFASDLLDAGVHILDNASSSIDVKGTRFAFYGLELPLPLYRKLVIPHLSYDFMTESIGKGPDPSSFSVLLSHNPQFAPLYARWGADLTVCGHFHGGVMRIGGRCLVSPYGFPFPRYGYGHFEKEGKHMIVTSGLGEHTIPLRIHNPMELVRIDLIPGEEEQNGH